MSERRWYTSAVRDWDSFRRRREVFGTRLPEENDSSPAVARVANRACTAASFHSLFGFYQLGGSLSAPPRDSIFEMLVRRNDV